MPWGAAIGAIGVLGSAAIAADSKGGAGSSTTTSEPWGPAQPWLVGAIGQGTELNDYYNHNMFSPKQEAAYANQYAQSDYMRNLVPSLLGQLQAQPVGYDPKSPDARAKAWDWSGVANALSPDIGQKSISSAAPEKAAVQQTQSQPLDLSSFRDTKGVQNLLMSNGTPALFGGMGGTYGDLKAMDPSGAGGYGSWTYGQFTKPGTQADLDRRMYFAMGGTDPNNLYNQPTIFDSPNARSGSNGGGI